MSRHSNTLFVGPAPHIARGPSSRFRFWAVSVCLLFPIVQSSIFDAGYSLLLAIASIIGVFAAEVFVERQGFKAKLLRGDQLVQALFLCLLLPAHTPFYIPLIASFCTSLLLKLFYRTNASSWIPLGLFGFLFVRIVWPNVYENLQTMSIIGKMELFHREFGLSGSHNPMDILKLSGYKPSNIDAGITRFINRHILRGLSAEIPHGYIDLLFNTDPHALIADRGGFAILLVTPFLATFRLIRFRTSFFFFLPWFFLLLLFEPLMYGAKYETYMDILMPGRGGDILFSLFTGTSMFSVFFLLQDRSFSGFSACSSSLIAFFSGVFTFIFRQVFHEVLGILYSLIIISILALFIRYIEHYIRYRSLQVQGE